MNIQKRHWEGLIGYEEASEAVCIMKEHTAPGPDRMAAAVLTERGLNNPDLVDMLNDWWTRGELPKN